MKREENIKNSLEKKFADKVEVEIVRDRRMFAKISGEILHEVVEYMFNELNFQYLPTITGTEVENNFEVLYHLHTDDGHIICTVRAVVPIEKPDLKTITDIIPGAIWYEREIKDLFGVNVIGLPDGERYPLPDDFPQDAHPLRKNWDPKQLKDYPDENTGPCNIK